MGVQEMWKMATTPLLGEAMTDPNTQKTAEQVTNALMNYQGDVNCYWSWVARTLKYYGLSQREAGKREGLETALRFVERYESDWGSVSGALRSLITQPGGGP
jgi:hypothetical protein